MTKQEAISKLVEMDVEQWGEAERAGVEQMHAGRSLASALTELEFRGVAVRAPKPVYARRAARSAIDDGVS